MSNSGLWQNQVLNPDPELIRIHAAFAKVLDLSGAAEHVEKLERDAEMNGHFFLNREVGFSTVLICKMAIIAV